MAARYLVRFDDICPTMNWAVWSRVEELLELHDVKPIVAIVPDNRDQKLAPCAARADFWDLTRNWQRRGWAIGLHGYQHLYTGDSGGIIGIHSGSEFAGLSADAQRQKLAAGVKIFEGQNLTPTVWVAPGHAFDEVTVRLLPEFGIQALSDGYFWRPVQRYGIRWVPQQLWRFRPMPFGVWTVCLHVNNWNDRALHEFEAALRRFAPNITNFAEVQAEEGSTAGMLDLAFEAAYGLAVRAKLRHDH